MGCTVTLDGPATDPWTQGNITSGTSISPGRRGGVTSAQSSLRDFSTPFVDVINRMWQQGRLFLIIILMDCVVRLLKGVVWLLVVMKPSTNSYGYNY